MDSSHAMNSVKRKRRKTRKCLDELRKRSRSNTVELSNETGTKSVSKNKENVHSNRIIPLGISNCNITSNRLTLRPNLLSKSIKSETITRPSLAQSNVNPDIIINKLKETKVVKQETNVVKQETNPSKIVTSTSVVSKTVLTNSTSGKDGHDSDAITFNIDSDSDNVNNSSNSFFLFSPISQALENEVKSRSPLAGSSRMSSSSPVSQHFGYDLYRDFMSSLPKYLHENVPCLFEVDVVKKVKDSLLNIYTEECQKESEQKIFKCLSSATQKGKDSNIGASSNPVQKKEKASISCFPQDSILKSFDHSTRQSSIANANNSILQKNHSYPSSTGLPEAIIQNPVEYIKANMARAQQRRAMLEPPSRSHLSIDSDTTLSPALPSLAPRTPPSPRPSTSRPPVSSVIHDTPEYTYYPRKLNL